MTFSLSPGHAHDAPPAEHLLEQWEDRKMYQGLPLVMDRAYEGDSTRILAKKLGLKPVVPPKLNREDPWVYDKTLYRKRNEVERLVRKLKAFRRVFSRFEKLDIMFSSFILLSLAFLVLFSVNTP